MGSELEKYKKNLKLSDLQREIIIGTLLGDSSMESRNDKPVYALKFEQKLERIDYINHLHAVFSEWSGMKPTIREIAQDEKFKQRSSVWFRTYQHCSFRFYYGIFYSVVNGEKRKIVPKLIHRFLTPRALAYWFMDDGTFHVDKYGNRQYYFSTQGFLTHEQVRLVSALKNKFSLEFNIHKDKKKYRLYLKSESRENFLEIIKPYVLPSMTYKL